VLAHSPSLNQTRWDLNSDYSDRLLGVLISALVQKRHTSRKKRAVDSWRPSGLIAVSGSSLAGSFLPPVCAASSKALLRALLSLQSESAAFSTV
jgi:hypothetical protein